MFLWGLLTAGERDLYELLGVEPEASEDDIKTAFRRRAKELHPDVNGDDSTQSFIEVTDLRTDGHGLMLLAHSVLVV
jgi:hypothetical protein